MRWREREGVVCCEPEEIGIVREGDLLDERSCLFFSVQESWGIVERRVTGRAGTGA